MGLIKMGLLFIHHYTTKIFFFFEKKKYVRTPIWVQEKNGRHLVKIEETYQEEVFQEGTLQGEASQEVMAASIDDTTA